MRLRLASFLVLALATAAMARTPPEPHHHAASATAVDPPPLFDHLGTYHRAISTKSPIAQRYFDQGMAFLFAFNMEEAQRAFEEAARLDPECPLCHWGVAMSLAPHINYPAQDVRTVAAHHAARAALAVIDRGSPAEQALIRAVAKRSSDPAPGDETGQWALDQGYADAMREVMRRFPDDADAAVFFAEAMMNLRPWDLWARDGQPHPGTLEILSVLEGVRGRFPDHPGAHHLTIHALEDSPHPEQALASAERIAELAPGVAHMVHMGSHIFVKVGRYAEASEVNRRAIEVDRRYLEKAGPLAIYPMYVGHNFQFLWSTSMMEGRRAEALENARAVVSQLPPEMLATMPGLDFMLGYPIWTQVRFSRWPEALAEPAPAGEMPYAQAVWHVARGLAFAARGELVAAEAEAALVTKLRGKLTADAVEGFNGASQLLTLAQALLAGRLAAARGEVDAAVSELMRAVEIEEGLKYNEPSDWYFPTRHVLGQVLLGAERWPQAQAVYEADLARHPENGWALAGLAASLRRQGKSAEAMAVETRLAKAWSRADVEVKGAAP